MKLTDIDQGILNQIVEASRQSPEVEACGIIIGDELTECFNVAPNPAEAFALDAECSERAIEHSAVVWHSHINQQARKFDWSPADIRASVECGLPYLVVHPESGKILFFDPSVRLPYEGREWNLFTANCQTLFIDFYATEFRIEIPRWIPESSAPWVEEGWDEYRRQGGEHGFRMLQQGEQQQYGDIALMKRGRAAAPNHVGILLEPEGNQILHHCQGQLSRKETYGRSLRDSCYALYRHPSVRVDQAGE